MEKELIQHCLSQILVNLEKTTSDKSNKLPRNLGTLSVEGLALLIRETYCQIVRQRGVPLQDINNSEIDTKIIKIAKWFLSIDWRYGLMLHGGSGTGKTTLLKALRCVLSQDCSDICYVGSLELHYRYLRALELNDNSLFAEYKKKKYLLVDDLGAEPLRCLYYGVDYSPIQELFEYRYATQGITICSSNLSEESIHERYGSRMFDRLQEMFLNLWFNAPSYRKALRKCKCNYN